MVQAIPQGLRSLTPQLNVNGAADAIDFWKRAFGAKEVMRAPDPTGKKVWHASLTIGDSAFFANDSMDEMAPPSRSTLWIYLDNVDAAFKRAVDAGATVRMPLADMFWGDRTGSVTDKWGITWVLAQHVKDMTPQEMQQAQDEFVAKMKA